MARLFSNRDDPSHDGIRVLHIVANHFCEMGHRINDLWHCPFAFQPISSQDDLDLLSTERQKKWDLKFRSAF